LQLINQLLDSAKLEASSMRLEESRGDVVMFVGQLIEPFRLQAEKKGIRLEYISEDKPSEYLFDAEKLEKIFDNLLANALKFTPSGGTVQVELTCYPAKEDKIMFSLKVSDTGIGIAAHQLPFIFKRFYQVNNSHTRNLAGSGLGLSLVKELTELLGGEVEVESQLGKGTTFRVTLPLREAESSVTSMPISALPVIAHQQETVLPDLPDFNENAPLILVVEDHEELREFIAGSLAIKYRVITANDGEEGWQLAQQELPNLVISDVAMPQMDGFTLSELIKSTPLTSHIALILLTASTSAEKRVKGLSTGANDYLPKPFNLQELHLRVANWLSYQQTLQKYWLEKFGQANLIELAAPLAEPPVEDPFLLKVNEVLQRELANSAFSVEELAQEMAVSLRSLHRKLSFLTGMNASDLLRTYRLNKAAALLREGYSVSEAAYQVGFEGLSYFSKCFKAQFSVSPSEYALSNTSK
jgi:DNA-binding response OmpR family regulator/two-component sensor histidine kinase